MKLDSYPRSLLAILGPSLAIAVSYFAFFQRPLERDLQRQLLRFQKLQSSFETQDDRTERLRLDSLTTEVRNLEQTLASSKAEAAHLVAKRSEMANILLGSAVPAKSMAFMLEAFEHHGMTCISSQPVENPTSKIPDALQPVANVLASQKKDLQHRFEFQFVVMGQFAEIQEALQDLSTNSSGVQIVSLAMELAEDDTDPRTWTITAVVWEPLP